MSEEGRAAGPLGRFGRAISRFARPVGVVVGLLLAFHFLRDAGIGRTLEIVRAAGVWIPLVVALQVGIVTIDALALRALLSDVPPAQGLAELGSNAREVGPPAARIPLRTWIRATAVANACGVFLPAGRAVGEVLRGAALAPIVGAPRAAGAGARSQACCLLGTAMASAVAGAVIWTTHPAKALVGLLELNAVVCATLGGGVFLLVRSARVTDRLRVIAAKFVRNDPAATLPSRRASVTAFALEVLGRAVQAVQYGIAIVSIGGHFDATSALTAQGIHLVGASAGDLLPAQLGAMEGIYSAFSGVLGLSEGPARALSLVVLMRGALVGLALAGVILAALLPNDTDQLPRPPRSS